MTIAWRAVTAPPDPLRRGPAERLQAWVITGPLGHLWSVAADLALFFSRRYYRSEDGRGSRSSARR
jgi:hypothetical protein